MVDSHRRVAALEGLVELGTPAAVEALVRMVDTLDAWGVRKIRFALWRIAEEGDDEEAAALARAAMVEHEDAFRAASEIVRRW